MKYKFIKPYQNIPIGTIVEFVDNKPYLLFNDDKRYISVKLSGNNPYFNAPLDHLELIENKKIIDPNNILDWD